MLSKKEQYEIAIAALLHDIGKFKQRAFDGAEKGNISSEVLSMEHQILPVFDGRYQYRHALWTYDFFLNDFFPLVLSNEWDIELDWEKIARESAAHHSPSENSYSAFIAQADRLSANVERYTGDEPDINSRTAYKKKPLRSIFDSIGKNTATKSNFAYELTSLSKAKSPLKINEENNLSSKYSLLWDEFMNELTQIKKLSSVMQLVNKLKDLLLEYTWCIPSATNDSLNDISLFDHSVVTMAFAVSLACSNDKNKPFRLFAADVSGIQKFIFQSNHDSFPNAAKIFRGRSFIISSLSTAYRLEIGDALGLIPFTDIIDAGGKFTLVLPNFEGIEKKLDELQKQQETFFLRNDLGTLCILADYSMAVNAHDLGMQITNTGRTCFSEKQIELSRRLNTCKSRKFSKVDLHDGWVLRDVNVQGNRCEACGIRVEETERKCSFCNSQMDLGRDITTKEYVSFVKNSTKGVRVTKNYSLVLKDSPSSDSLCYHFENYEDSNAYPLWRLNNYTVNKEFSEIAQAAVDENNNGKPFLAYIKMDVDSLGEIFINGLPKEIYTISRYVTISRLLNYFFNVQVKNLLRKRFPDSYTVISGGDDVFVIMPWNQVMDFVLEMNFSFKDFCCSNTNLHFSTGVVVTGPSVPFALVNKKTNGALDEGAKRKEGKNCIKFFDHVLSYHDLMVVQKEANTLIRFIKNPKYSVSSSFIYRVYNYINDRLSNNPIRDFSSYSKFYYDLARNIKGDSIEADEARKYFLNKMKEDSDSFEMFKVALIVAMYSQRETIKEDAR